MTHYFVYSHQEILLPPVQKNPPKFTPPAPHSYMENWYAPLITADADRQVALALFRQHSSFLVGGSGGMRGWESVFMCVLQRATTLKGRRCVVCIWYVNGLCVCAWVFGGTQPALPARGSAAKTIICDRSARDDSLPHDSLMPSNDQNRKKLTGRRVKVSEGGTKTQKEREIDCIPEWGKKQSECAMKVQDVKCAKR